MLSDDLNERYRRAQMSRLPDYHDGFDAGRQSMRWWLAAAGTVGFVWGVLMGMVLL